MKHGIIFSNTDIIYTKFKKHYCIKCNTKLNTCKISKIVNRKSEEAKNYDFQIGHTYAVGNVEFIAVGFECPLCGEKFTVEEMKEIESKSNIYL